MPSPFPGMNPFLEKPHLWPDFHSGLMKHFQAQLNDQLLPDFFCGVEQHLYVEEMDTDANGVHIGVADVSLHETRPVSRQPVGVLTLVSPARGVVPVPEVDRLYYLTIRDREGHEIVTVIEVLSPANKKSGKTRDQFLAKRETVLTGSAHYVEIDLLRGGARPPIDGLPDCQYYAMVSPVDSRPDVALWPIQLPDPLPELPIPVTQSREPARLAMLAALNQAYDGGGYAYRIYNSPPVPPLSPDEAAWAAQFVAAGTIR